MANDRLTHAGADLVSTGEGSIDEQNRCGKAPIGVNRAAHACGIPTVAVAGRSTLSRARDWIVRVQLR